MRAVLLAMASVGLVGCIGQLDSGGSGSVGTGTNPNPTGTNSQAQQMFEQNVYPIIHSGSASLSDCSQCHDAAGPSGNTVGFVADSVSDAYATATSYQQLVGNFTPTEAGILTQVSTGHNGRVYTADQITAITNWLSEEVTERAGTTTSGSGSTDDSPAAATARVLNAFSACMSLTYFNSAKMATAWGQMQADNGSRCESCHATGGQGFIATEIATTTGTTPGLFTTISQDEYYMVQYFTVDLSGGAAAAKVMINTTSFMGVSDAQPPHVEHPTFNATTNAGMTALTTFYNSVMAAETAAGAAGCGTTQLNPPAS